MDRKERDKLELAKKRSPAHDFQRQIKFDPKQHPALKKESEHPKWKLIFSAATDAQGFADVLDVTKDRTKMTTSEIDLDDVQNKAMCPVFQQTLLTPETQGIALELEKSEENPGRHGRMSMIFSRSLSATRTTSLTC